MPNPDSDFKLLTSLAYHPNALEPFPLLERHYTRLRDAHAALGRLPEVWCSNHEPLGRALIEDALWRCVRTAGADKPQRVRLTVGPDSATAVSAGLAAIPVEPVKLSLDDRPTDYSDPFLRHKTTRRDLYDQARARRGATLVTAPDSIFDVLMFNAAGEVTESTIANFAVQIPRHSPSGALLWITPRASSGLLAGVMRAELLDRQEIEEGVVTVETLRAAAKTGAHMKCFNAVRGSYTVELVENDW